MLLWRQRGGVRVLAGAGRAVLCGIWAGSDAFRGSGG